MNEDGDAYLTWSREWRVFGKPNWTGVRSLQNGGGLPNWRLIPVDDGKQPEDRIQYLVLRVRPPLSRFEWGLGRAKRLAERLAQADSLGEIELDGPEPPWDQLFKDEQLGLMQFMFWLQFGLGVSMAVGGIKDQNYGLLYMGLAYGFFVLGMGLGSVSSTALHRRNSINTVSRFHDAWKT